LSPSPSNPLSGVGQWLLPLLISLALNFFLYTCLLSFLCALALSLFFGKSFIEWLRNKRWKKDATVHETWAVREDTPDTHLVKQGTPSMGGIGIAACAIAAYLAIPLTLIVNLRLAHMGSAWLTGWPWFGSWPGYGGPKDAFVFLLLPIVFASHALLGFCDDWSKASGRGGLRARTKLAGQIFLAFAFIYCLVDLTWTQSFTGVRYIFPGLSLNSDLLFMGALASLTLLIIGTCNAVNLTDGIDGLAAGLAVQCGFALALCGQNSYEVGQLSILFWCTLAGACLGFLFLNRHPARVFMGDTGSLAIGAALGAAAILQHAVFLLPFIGFIYFVEMLSVVTQVLWFKWTKRRTGEGKRLFRRAPLHHHFELGGWSEWRVVGTFWLINLFTSAIGILLWQMEIIPHWP
jgi:phospho-N-acetylmuramoyl-pentapeptide-transferase